MALESERKFSDQGIGPDTAKAMAYVEAIHKGFMVSTTTKPDVAATLTLAAVYVMGQRWTT